MSEEKRNDKEEIDAQSQKEHAANSTVDETPERDQKEIEQRELKSEPVDEDRTFQLTSEIETLKNQLLRKAAEFENYKRRTANETASIIRFANEGLIVELLSVLDDLDRSLKAGNEHSDFESFYKGIDLVRGKLNKILESRGLKKIDSLGQTFDVDYHDALLVMPKEGVESHTIIDEIEYGYKLHDKVIRHAKVIVAAELQPTEADAHGNRSEPVKEEA